MPTIEYREEAGLVICRGLIDEETAYDFSAACEDWAEGIPPGAYLSTEGRSSPDVDNIEYELNDEPRLAIIQDVAGLALEATANHMDETELTEYGLTVLSYRGFAFQDFHADATEGKVLVIHGDDDGAYDFLPLDTDLSTVPQYQMTHIDGTPFTMYVPKEFETIPVNAGDMVVKLNPLLVHRGRNLARARRLGLALAA